MRHWRRKPCKWDRIRHCTPTSIKSSLKRLKQKKWSHVLKMRSRWPWWIKRLLFRRGLTEQRQTWRTHRRCETWWAFHRRRKRRVILKRIRRKLSEVHRIWFRRAMNHLIRLIRIMQRSLSRQQTLVRMASQLVQTSRLEVKWRQVTRHHPSLQMKRLPP